MLLRGADQKGKELFISNYLQQLPDSQQLTLFEPIVKYGLSEQESK